MRIVNDREAKPEPQEAGFLEVFSYSLLCAVGISSGFFAPLAMLVCHLKLPENFARISSVIGAGIALVLLGAYAPGVMIAFVVSLYVADRAARDESLWRLLFGGAAIGMIAAISIVYVGALREQSGLLVFWKAQVSRFVGAEEFARAAEWAFGAEATGMAREFLTVQGPSVFVSAVLVSVWLAVGIGAHLNWFSPSSALSADGLRKIKSSRVLVIAYALSILAILVLPPAYRWFAECSMRILSSLVLIQGTIAMARLLAARGATPGVRTFVYALGLTFGYYGVIGLGIIGPWVAPKTRRVRQAQV